MALKTRASIKDIGEILSRKASEFTFQDPPLIDVPNTEILNFDSTSRQVRDPSKRLRPAMGLERVITNRTKLALTKRGPDDRLVYELTSGDDRINFVGNWINANGTTGSFMQAPSGETENFVEVVFFGTGLNLLGAEHAGALDWRVSVDGGAEGSNIYPAQVSILNGRSVRPNIPIPLVTGLSLGLHTVKLRKADVISDFIVCGFEIEVDSTQIQVPEGEIFANGLKYKNSALLTSDYNTGFDGSPVLNGRGGRIAQYITPEGQVRKVIQQVGSSPSYLASTDHSNEEVIGRFSFRSFGANIGTDFSTMTTNQDRAFTLEDGTTHMVCDDCSVGSSLGFEALFQVASGDFYSFVFVGTGLDVVGRIADSTSTLQITVDGASIGNYGVDTGNGGATPGIHKICADLPYGTHVVRFNRNGSDFSELSEFITYGPKAPVLPDSALKIQDYFLMADFVANTTAGLSTISQGVIRKQNHREFILVQGTTGTENWTIDGGANPTDSFGFNVFSDRLDAYVEYTFFGTGFDVRLKSDPSHSSDIEVYLNGNLATTGNFPTLASSGYGGTSFAAGSIDASGASGTGSGVVIQDLPLDIYTVRFQNKVASARIMFQAFDIIAPTHFPAGVGQARVMDSGVQLSDDTSDDGVDLSKAKAWLLYEQGGNQIYASHNISAVVDVTTGVHQVYFETPFKTDRYIAVATSNPGETRIDPVGSARTRSYCRVVSANSSGTGQDGLLSVVFFGELEGEGE